MKFAAGKPEEGDWVLVWAQLLKQEQVHPEDYVIDLFSHNEQYQCDVRKDRVLFPEKQPDFAPRCTSVYSGGSKNADTVLWQCVRGAGHTKKHRANSDTLEWEDNQTIGHIDTD